MHYVLALVVLAAVGSGANWSGRVTARGGMWGLNYTIDTTSSKFIATVICRSKGWIGLGLSYNAGSRQAKTDSMVAFTINGTNYIHDQFSMNHTHPVLDVTLGGREDLALIEMGSNGAFMWVTYSRNLDTKDGDRDLVIENKDVYVDWACGNDIPIVKNNSTIDYYMPPNGQFGAIRANFFNATAPNAPSRSRNRVRGIQVSSSRGSSDPSNKGDSTTAPAKTNDACSMSRISLIALTVLFFVWQRLC